MLAVAGGRQARGVAQRGLALAVAVRPPSWLRLGLQRVLLLVFKLLSKPDWRDGEDVLGCCRGAFQAEADDLRFRVMGFRKPDRISGWLAGCWQSALVVAR